MKTSSAVRGLMKQMCEENHSLDTLKILIIWEGYRWLNNLLMFSVRCSHRNKSNCKLSHCKTGNFCWWEIFLGRKFSIIKKTILKLAICIYTDKELEVALLLYSSPKAEKSWMKTHQLDSQEKAMLCLGGAFPRNTEMHQVWDLAPIYLTTTAINLTVKYRNDWFFQWSI